MASFPFIGPADQAPPAADRRAADHRRLGGRLRLVPAVGELAQVDEVTRGQGKVIPSSKLQVITAADAGDRQRTARPLGPARPQGRSCWRGSTDPKATSQLGQIEAETQSLQARSARLTAGRHGHVDAPARATDCAGEQALRAARESALRSKVAALSAAADQRAAKPAEAAATISSLQGSLALAQQQVAMLEPLAAKNIVPQTDLLDKRREVVDLQGRIAGGARAAGPGAGRGPRGAGPGERRPVSNSASRRSTSAARSTPRSRSTSSRCAAPQGKLEPDRDPLAGRRRRQRRPGDDHRRLSSSRARRSWKSCRWATSCSSRRASSRSDIAFIKVGDRALVKVTAYDFSIYGGLEGRVVQVSADSIYDENEKQAYFTVIVETDKSYLTASGARLPITPGMMTDTQIITGRKSVLTYLLKPVLKARSDALRER